MNSRFPRTYATQLHVAAESRKDAHDNTGPAPRERFTTGGNLDFHNVPIRQPSKFGNVKTDGFDSKREAKRYTELMLLERAGQIAGLRTQVEYILIPRQLDHDGRVAEHACVYRADYVYVENGVIVVEDSKGHATRDYIIKRKLMRFVHGIVVREV